MRTVTAADDHVPGNGASTACAVCFCDVQLLQHLVLADALYDLASSGAIHVYSLEGCQVGQLSDSCQVQSFPLLIPPLLRPFLQPCISSFAPQPYHKPTI